MSATTFDAPAPPRITTLILLCALSVISLNMFMPSLNNIAVDLETDYALVTLAIAAYSGVAAVLHLLVGPLSDRFGRRPVILGALAIFTLASVGCALSTSIEAFLAFRMAQAVVSSCFVVALAVIRDTHEPKAAASLMGYMAAVWGVAPMLGPLFGGALDETFDWRASFWAFAIFGAALLALCWIDLGETNTERRSSLPEQLRSYAELVGSRLFWAFTLCMGFSIGAFYAFLSGAPYVVAQNFPMSETALGATMGVITIGYIVGSLISGRFSEALGLAPMALLGRMVACVGLSIGLVVVLAGVVHPISFFAACMCVGVGNGLTTPNASAGAMSIDPRLAGSAAGLSAATTVGLGGVMAALTGAALTETNAAPVLLLLMLTASALGLVAALVARGAQRSQMPRDA